MKTFVQHLEEGRDAPLYHGTTLYDCFNEEGIIKSNKLSSFFRPNISLTRNLRTALNWSVNRGVHDVDRITDMRYKPGVVIELDQRKLAQNKKLIPVNMANIWAQRGEFDYDRGSLHSKSESLFEEQVKAPLKNLNQYMTKIITQDVALMDDMIKNQCQFKYGERVKIEPDYLNLLIKMRKHHLLYDAKTKRFVN